MFSKSFKAPIYNRFKECYRGRRRLSDEFREGRSRIAATAEHVDAASCHSLEQQKLALTLLFKTISCFSKRKSI